MPRPDFPSSGENNDDDEEMSDVDLGGNGDEAPDTSGGENATKITITRPRKRETWVVRAPSSAGKNNDDDDGDDDEEMSDMDGDDHCGETRGRMFFCPSSPDEPTPFSLQTRPTLTGLVWKRPEKALATRKKKPVR